MALSTEQQLALFKVYLSESKYDLSQAQKDIETAFLKAVSQGQTQKQTVVNEKKTKKKSGYTLFLSEKMGKEKMGMGETVAAWKVLSTDDKAVWNHKAKEMVVKVPQAPQMVAKKPHKKSGYNLFLSEKMGVEKMKMGEAVAAWKALSTNDKAVWNGKVL